MAVQGCVLSLWLWLWLSLLPALLGARAVGAARWRGEGTTPHLQSIFLGRCAEYTTLLSLQPGNKNCTAIWEAFKVVLDKDPCSVLPSDYDLFINLSRHSIPRDKSLFWENNHLLVMSYAESARRLMPLCDVLYGKVGDFLSWCRQENASGLDYQSCPTSEDCENNAVDSYWKSASMQHLVSVFKRQFRGDQCHAEWLRTNRSLSHKRVRTPEDTTDDTKLEKHLRPNVMLAFVQRGKWFFADFEIPYLQKDKVTRIDIWVMHDVGGPNVESCGEGSVKILEDRLEALGFQHSCTNDYPAVGSLKPRPSRVARHPIKALATKPTSDKVPVKFLMCVDHSTHPDCVMNSAPGTIRRESPSLRAIGDASLIISLLLALASSSQG
ncbi:ADP-ribosyl cyclase/cyclic ADP-ribose hydrolase [Apodemus speciosus]|uniref:ADP-ribosyl cyclase/cyclic ADP-ribose hydrolase n=1 Tax=Apodemus speciosus TaxID=105296 RepID=A0ABQ0ERI3_APOSI